MKKENLLERRRLIADVFVTAAFLGVLAFYWFVAFSYYSRTSEGSWGANAFSGLVVAIAAGYPTLYIFKAIDRNLIQRHIAPSWCIENCGDVIKVHGSIPIDDWHYVQSRMLKVRPDFMPIDDAHVHFGCTMAAVPATPAWLQARKAYRELMSKA